MFGITALLQIAGLAPNLTGRGSVYCLDGNFLFLTASRSQKKKWRMTRYDGVGTKRRAGGGARREG